MNIVAKDAKTVFLLARYAERVFAPMVQELESVSADLYVECALGAKAHTLPWHVDVRVHWNIDGMAMQEICLNSTDKIDRAAVKFRGVVAQTLEDRVAA